MPPSLLGTGGEAVLPVVETTLFDASVDGGSCSAYRLKNLTTTLKAKVCVKGMHIDNSGSGGTDGRAIVEKTDDNGVLFEWDSNIDKITAIALTSSVLLRGFVVRR